MNKCSRSATRAHPPPWRLDGQIYLDEDNVLSELSKGTLKVGGSEFICKLLLMYEIKRVVGTG